MATKEQEYLAQGGTLVNGQIPTATAPTETSPGVFAPINSASLTPTPTIPFQTPSPATPFSIAGLDATAPLTPTQPESQATDLTARIQQLNERLLGQSATRATAETQVGLPELQKTQTDLSSQLKALQNEALALQNKYSFTIPNQQVLEGEGRRSTGQIQALTDRERRSLQIQQGDIATRALGVSSLLEASRGNLALAQQQVDRAVSERYQPILEEIAVKQANLQLVLQSPEYTLAEKNRAMVTQSTLETQKKEAARQAENNKTAQAMAAMAVKNNPGDTTAQLAAQNVLRLDPKSPDYLSRAFELVGRFQSDPVQMANDLLQNKLLEARISEIPFDNETKRLQQENLKKQLIIPGISKEPFAGFLDETEIKKIDTSPQGKKVKALGELKQKVQGYRALVDLYGTETPLGGQKTNLDAAFADLKIAYKEAANLGALTGPDVQLLEEAIKPAGFGGFLAPVKRLGAILTRQGKTGIINGIDQTLSIIEKNAQKNISELYKRDPRYPQSFYVQEITRPFTGELQDLAEEKGFDIQAALDSGYTLDEIREELNK